MGKSTRLFLAFLLIVPGFVPALALQGDATGSVAGMAVDAIIEPKVLFGPLGSRPTEFEAFPVNGRWSFQWTDDGVDFSGDIVFGDYSTITDAGSLGGITRQNFYGFAHHLAGSGEWNESQRTMTFVVSPEEREDGRASRISQSREPDCERLGGIFAGRTVEVFRTTSHEAEGVDLTLRFNSDYSRFEGELLLIQYGGKGISESTATLFVSIEGSLSPDTER